MFLFSSGMTASSASHVAWSYGRSRHLTRYHKELSFISLRTTTTTYLQFYEVLLSLLPSSFYDDNRSVRLCFVMPGHTEQPARQTADFITVHSDIDMKTQKSFIQLLGSLWCELCGSEGSSFHYWYHYQYNYHYPITITATVTITTFCLCLSGLHFRDNPG